MATIYPKLTNNVGTTGGSNKFNFPDLGDSDFDIYVFEDTAGNEIGQHTAFMLFLIKNVATAAGANLIINSITGNSSFNNLGFELNPTDASGNLFLGTSIDGNTVNKIKTSNTSTGTSTTPGNASACASGASGFVGVGGDIVDYGDEENFSLNSHANNLNASGSTNCVPIYTTSYITSNPLPTESYCAFVVKFKPNQAFNENEVDIPAITIANSAQNITIEFTANAANLLTFSGHWGTATDGVSGDDSFTATGDVMNDGENNGFGLFPVGHIGDATDKTLQLGDISSTAGTFVYHGDPVSGNSSQNQYVVRLGTLSLNKDGQSWVDDGPDGVLERYRKSIYHTDAVFRPVASCADQTASNMFTQAPWISTTNPGGKIYKNFQIRGLDNVEGGGVHVNTRSTHIDWYHVDTDKYDDYLHTTSAAVSFKAQHVVGKILNSEYPAQTDDNSSNQYFAFGVTTGYYNKLSMSSAQIDYHKGANHIPSVETHDNIESRHFNVGAISDLNNSPYVQATSGAMFRDSSLNLGLNLRYNYFGSETGEEFRIPEFSLQDTTGGGVEFYGSYSDDMVPSHYNTSEFNNIYGSNISTSADGVTFNTFNSEGNNGSYLGLKYPLNLNKLVVEHFYGPGLKKQIHTGSKGGYNLYGLNSAIVRPGNIASNNVFKQGLGEWNAGGMNYIDEASVKVKYKFAYHLRPSALQLQSTSEGTFTYSPVLVGTSAGGGSEEMPTYKYSNTSWRINGTNGTYTNTASDYGDTGSDTKPEGAWLGAAGAMITKPFVWDQSGSGRVYADWNGSNPGWKIDHGPEHKYIRTGSSSYYNETILDNCYFELTPARYDVDNQTYRSLGIFFLKNTGDYPIYMQSVSIGSGTAGGSMGSFGVYRQSGVGTGWMDGEKHYGKSEGIPLPHDGTSNIQHVKPVFDSADAANSSNDPVWLVGQPNQIYYFDQSASSIAKKNTDTGQYVNTYHETTSSSSGTTGGRSGIKWPEDHTSTGSTTKTPFNHFDQQSNANTCLVETKFDDHALPVDSLVTNSGRKNYISVAFELTPKAVSALDQGDYYAVIQLSYYVGDYRNEKVVNQNVVGLNHSNLNIGDESNNQTGLFISRHLVKCTVQSVGNIEITDTEGDEAPTTVVLPTLSVG
jgi:hypothetical protein